MSSVKYILQTNNLLFEKSQTVILCEKEEPVIGKTKESTACQNYFQQVVQFSEPDHLLL